MRPEDFSPGNRSAPGYRGTGAARFNEAGGFLPRKHRAEAILERMGVALQ